VTYLLDVSSLLALLWKTHVHHERVSAWQDGLSLAVCPLTELGFLRISTQPAFGLSVRNARNALKGWKERRKPAFVPCDLEALDTDPPSKGTLTTDFYLASLAARHGMTLATLDEAIPHRGVLVIPA
jgi:predicted nucleic acid-binding protein